MREKQVVLRPVSPREKPRLYGLFKEDRLSSGMISRTLIDSGSMEDMRIKKKSIEGDCCLGYRIYEFCFDIV